LPEDVRARGTAGVRIDLARLGAIAKYEGGERRIDVVEFVTVCQAIGADPAKLLKALIKAIGGASD
jgi:hypothetical protein